MCLCAHQAEGCPCEQVNVIYGCNEKCSYCVVPNTRGQEQSRTPDAIKVGAACCVV